MTRQEIERSILQQLLYGADADKLPLSRFKRIKSPGFWSIFRSLYILAGVLALWHAFSNRAAIFDGSYFEPLDITNWLDISVAALALIFLWSAIHHFYVASFGVSLQSISLKDIEIRPSSEDQDSILNRHLDEIIYFFQSTRYDLVIVEDLDRFEDSDIFVTLREINSLVNGNAGVRRRIRFLYPNVAQKLYEFGHYRLNEANFDYIFGSILGEETGSALRKRHYSRVRNSGAEPLLERVENDFETYFANVLMEMADNAEEDIDAILAVMSHDTLDAVEVETFVLRQTKLLPTLENVPERYQAMVFRSNRIVPTWSNCLDFIRSTNFEQAALIAFLSDDEVRAGLLETPLREGTEALPLRQFLINAEDLEDEVYRAYVKALPHEFKKFPEVISARKRQILIDERRVTFDVQNFSALNGEVDLQTIFVARNISSYLRAPSSFSADDNFRERLLAADISDNEKREIIDLMDLSVLSNLPDRAGIIGPILLRTNVAMPSLTPDVVMAIIVNSRPVGTQIRLLNFLHEKLDKNEVREVLGQLPDPYSRIQTGYTSPTLRRTNENSELVRWLDERDIISSVGTPFWSNDIKVNLYRS